MKWINVWNRNRDELANLLMRTKEMEAAFESVADWEGYIDIRQDEFRSMLFYLISESQIRKNTVDFLISKTWVSQNPTLVLLAPRLLDFRNKHELEIMGEIGKYEKLALDLRTGILEAPKKSDIKRLRW